MINLASGRWPMLGVMLLLAFAGPADAARLSAVGSNGYGCKSGTALKQLRFISAVRTAFEIALLDKIQSGECWQLTAGEALDKIEDAQFGNLIAVKVRRANGDELFVEAQYVEPSI